MGHAREYSPTLVFAGEAVGGTVRHYASSPPCLDQFSGQGEEDEMYPAVFPGLRVTRDLGHGTPSTAVASATASRTASGSASTDRT